MWRVVAVVMLGCGRLDFDPRQDAGAPADTATACVLGPWAPPTRITAVGSTSTEWGPALSPDGLELLFSSDRTTNYEFYRSTRARTTDPFGPPELLVQVNSADLDSSPTYAPGGLTIYFASNRSGAVELYRSSRPSTTELFTDATLVSELSGMSINGPALSADGSEMFFGATSLQRARYTEGTGFTVVGPVSELNQGRDGYPSVSADGKTLYFVSMRNGSAQIEVWSATRTGPGAPFTNPTHVDLGGSADDPEISKDDRTLVFASARSGDYELYLTTRDCL